MLASLTVTTHLATSDLQYIFYCNILLTILHILCYDQNDVSPSNQSQTQTAAKRTTKMFVSKKLNETWCEEPPVARQCRAQNVIKTKAGPTAFAKQRVSTESPLLDCFLVMFTPAMIDTVVNCTNLEGRRKNTEWNDVNAVEMKAFVGLLLLRGVYKASGESTEELCGVQMAGSIFQQP
jgi:hypothetical protein